MKCFILISLSFAIVNAIAVHVSGVSDAHVNVQVAHDTNQQSRISMHGGQTSSDAHSPEDNHVHDNDHLPEQSANKERTKGTLNYHKTKKIYHKVKLDKYTDKLNAHVHNSEERLPQNQDPQEAHYKMKYLEHSEKLAKHKGLIRDLKDGTKVPGKKTVDHLRERNKMPKGYQ